MDVKNCRICGAAITFIRTEKGKYMPCDAKAKACRDRIRKCVELICVGKAKHRSDRKWKSKEVTRDGMAGKGNVKP